MKVEIPFLGLFGDKRKSRIALIPAPLEVSTSWKKGTFEAPFEIFKVSPNLEFFDEEVFVEPHKELGFYTYPVVELPYEMEKAFSVIEETLKDALSHNLLPFVIGGEHSVTYPVIKVLKEKYQSLKILHFDAHLDLRDSYRESKMNHATVMRRVFELGDVEIFSIGVRSFSKEEWEFAGERPEIFFWTSYKIKENFDKFINALKEFIKNSTIYISFDVDVFDPSVIPGVGTPEPAGLSWFEVVKILRTIFEEKGIKFVGMDFVEVKPDFLNPVSEYSIAKLIFKTASYLAVNPFILP